MSRRFALLVNPASAGGRALSALPEVIETLDRLGAQHRTVTTRSVEHAQEEARRASEQGETVAALGGDGLLRPLAGALKGRDTALALIPCGRGNDLARVLGVPQGAARGGARRPWRAASGCIDVASVDGTPFLGIASFGFDTDANRIANEATDREGRRGVRLCGAQGADRLAARPLHRDGGRRAPRAHRVLGGRRQLGRLRRRHVPPPPRPARRRRAGRAHVRATPRS